jgi:hypothetical protein
MPRTGALEWQKTREPLKDTKLHEDTIASREAREESACQDETAGGCDLERLTTNG